MPCTIFFAASVQPDGSAILAGTVAWGPSPGPNLGAYELQWSTDGGTSWPGGATLGADTLSYVIAPALAETSYQARVRAVSMNGQAKSTWEVSAAVNSGALVSAVPAAPSGLAAAAIAGAIALGWNANASGDAVRSYQLVREAGTVTGDPTSAATIFSGDALTATDSTTGASATFTYWVRAANAKGAGAWSVPVTQTSGVAVGGTSPADTIKGNDTGASAATMDLTPARVAAMLPAVIGDGGSGGVQGLVPAPAAGDAAAGKYLKADGTWAVPPGSGGGGGGGFNPYAAGVPELSRWTQVNATGASFAQGVVSGGTTTALSITAPEKTSDSSVLLTMAAPAATPYRVAVCGKLSATIAPYISMFAGWVDATGKMQVIGISDRTSGAYDFGLSVYHQDAPVPTTSAADTTPLTGLPADTVWFGLRNDGTTIYFEWSQDSVNWVTIYSVAATGGYLADAGKICIGINPVNAGSTGAIPDTATFVTVDLDGLGRTLASVYGSLHAGKGSYPTATLTPPTLSQFTQLGDGTFNGTATQGAGYILMDAGTAGGGSAWLQTEGTVWTVGKTLTITATFTTPQFSMTYWTVRVALNKDLVTVSTLTHAGPQAQNNGNNILDFDVWVNSEGTNLQGLTVGGIVWVRIRLSNSIVDYDISADGLSWSNLCNSPLPSGIAEGDVIYPGIFFGAQQTGSWSFQVTWISLSITVG